MSALAWTLVSLESVSVFGMLVRWSFKWHRGDYKYKTDWGQTRNDDAGPVVGAIVGGLCPPVALAYVLGAWLYRREVRRDEERKRLAAEEREVERLLEAKP